MEVKKINTDTIIEVEDGFRPESFDSFVGQEHIKKVLQTTIDSAKQRESNMWHILFCWPSGFGKTTMAHIIS